MSSPIWTADALSSEPRLEQARASGVRAVREHPADAVQYAPTAFGRDPRIAALRWMR